MSLAIADCLVAILVMPMGMIAEVIGKLSRKQKKRRDDNETSSEIF